MTKPNDSLDLIPAFDEHEAAESAPSDANGATREAERDLVLPAPLESAPVATAASVADEAAADSTGLSPDELFGDVILPERSPESVSTQQAAGAETRAPAGEAAGSGDSGQGVVGAVPSTLEADELFDEVPPSEPEPAAPQPWSDAEQARVIARIEYLNQCRTRVLEAYRRAGEDKAASSTLERTRKEGEELLTDAAELIETLSARPEATQARQTLVDAYFRLQRAVAQGQAETGLYPAKVKPSKSAGKQTDKAAAALAQRARDATKGQRKLGRAGKMLIFLGILATARVALLFGGQDERKVLEPARIEQLPDEAGVTRHIADKKKPTEGPVIRHVALLQSEKGLHAIVSCGTNSTEGNQQLRYTYTWFENDQILGVGAEEQVNAQSLTPGAEYHFEVRVTDGEHTTSAASDKLIFGKGKGG
jgi:hypothetical protein